MRVRVRYFTPDEKGQKRHERNEQFGATSPPLIIPSTGVYLWNWYFTLSDQLRRVRNSVCEPIPPSEFMAWCQATGNIVYPSEYAILCAMDAAYCAEMNIELQDFRARQAEENAKANSQLHRMGYKR